MTTMETAFYLRRAQAILKGYHFTDDKTKNEQINNAYQDAFELARLVINDFNEAQNEAFDVGWQSAANQLKNLCWKDAELVRRVLSPHPFTQERLQEIEPGQWVWVERLIEGDGVWVPKSGYYKVQPYITDKKSFCCGYPEPGYELDYSEYGHQWLAYPHKPFAKEDHYA